MGMTEKDWTEGKRERDREREGSKGGLFCLKEDKLRK